MLCLLVAGMAGAQKVNQRDYISMRLVPNHADWVYEVGEEVEIEVAAIRHYVPIPNIDLQWEWGMEQRQPSAEGIVSSGKKGVQVLRLKGAAEPGFYTLQVGVSIDGKAYHNSINIAFAPEQIQPTAVLPADFDTFWEQSVAIARSVPLKPLLVPLPERSTPEADVYEVRFQNYKEGQYLYGTLAVPSGVNPRDSAARYPALIVWPGAGVKPHHGDVDYFPARGVITLEMGINGIPVNLPQQVYDDLRANALRDYNAIHNDDREAYYYRRVYAGTVKTVDFLCALPCVDTARIGCYGGSQGGALSIVNAALDKRIKVAAVAYPALAEIAGYMRGRVAGWPKWKKMTHEQIAVADYYDVVNFARKISCPVWFSIGFNDQVCCPTTTYSVYNVLECPKELFTPLDCAHWMYPEHKVLRAEWLLQHL